MAQVDPRDNACQAEVRVRRTPPSLYPRSRNESPPRCLRRGQDSAWIRRIVSPRGSHRSHVRSGIDENGLKSLNNIVAHGYKSQLPNLEENAHPWKAKRPRQSSPLSPIRPARAMCTPCVSAAVGACSHWAMQCRTVVRSAGSRSTPPTREACATFATDGIESNSRWRSPPGSRLQGYLRSDGGLA